jgi:hypothetical protein
LEKNAVGPITSVVLGCDAVGSNESVVVGNFATSGGNSKNVVSGYMANAPEKVLMMDLRISQQLIT